MIQSNSALHTKNPPRGGGFSLGRQILKARSRLTQDVSLIRRRERASNTGSPLARGRAEWVVRFQTAPLQINKPERDALGDGVRLVGRVQFTQKIFDMGFHRVGRNMQDIGGV